VAYFDDNYSQLRLPLSTATTAGIREAQLAASHAVSAHFFGRKEPAIVVMPTGSGKSAVMLLVAFMLRAQRVLVLTPSRMVRDQLVTSFSTLAVLRKAGAIGEGVANPKVHRLDGRPADTTEWELLRGFDVVVATVQSASPVLEGVGEPPADLFDLILCDEAHHEPAPTWRQLLDHYHASRKALFTATPFRRDERALRGRLVFDYPLARAREDGVFGHLEYIPIEPDAGLDPDVALAQAADAELKAARARGHKDLVMVRTSQKVRAEALAQIYSQQTSLKLKTILGNHTQRHVEGVLKQMREGELDGVICVDMLGEGFDLPELKLAVLHSPHKSLSVTLQFIGRFARTNAENTGHARFLAVPSEIDIEAQPLYVPGAAWNELVEEASRRKVEAERDGREMLETFQRSALVTATPEEDLDENLDLSSFAPFFHVKVLEAACGVDLDQPFTPPVVGERIFFRRSSDHNAIVCVTRDSTPCRWADDSRLVDVTHDLFILFYDDETHLLFICTSRRETAVYDALVAMVAPEARRLSPEELNRVLRGVSKASFFSVGMRNRSGFGYAESYRMISGKKADNAIQKSDGRFYDRGHCFGRGEDAGATITIGFSSGSKIWANRWEGLPRLFDWCKKLAKKLVDTSAVETSSGLDNLPLGRRVQGFPNHIVTIDWHEEVYKREGLALWLPNAESRIVRVPLVDLTLRATSVADDQIDFVVRSDHSELEIEYRLDRDRWFTSSATDVKLVGADGKRELAFLDFIHDYPPSFFAADMSRIEGDHISTPTDLDDVFDRSLIEEVDWTAAGVNPLKEKPDAAPGLSIFEWLQTRLLASSVEVVFNDDGAGEAADFISLARTTEGHIEASLYHCKAAAKDPIPGHRVEDLYEVTGQAVKSVRFANPGLLRDQLVRRYRKANWRLLKGTRTDIEALLADGATLSVTVFIVQPGVGRRLRKAHSNLLGSANAYLVAGQVTPLKVIGSVVTLTTDEEGVGE
jgi:superfamily II DNA or RNA helicase